MAGTPHHLLDQTITIQRRTAGLDAGRSPTSTPYTTHLANIPARVQPQIGRKAKIAASDRGVSKYTVFVEGGQDIVTEDRIVWGSRTMTITAPPKALQGGVILDHIEAEDRTP